MPHYPAAASPEFDGTSEYGPYGDAVQELDWSTDQILKKLKELEIDHKKIILPEPIKQLGVYTIPIRLIHDVEAKVKLWVVKE